MPRLQERGGPHVREMETELRSDPSSVKVARDFVSAALAVWDLDDLSEVAVLLTSELVTNAVVHARTALQVRASFEPPGLLVEVHDGSPDPAGLSDRSPDAESGRGLTLVRGLATSWGIRPEMAGKTVWFRLAAPGASGGSL